MTGWLRRLFTNRCHKCGSFDLVAINWRVSPTGRNRTRCESCGAEWTYDDGDR